MTLRWRLVSITSALVLVLFGLSEWLSYRHTVALLTEHENILLETADHAVALEKLRATRETMFHSVAAVRVVNAALTLLVAIASLNYVWYRVIYRPIRRLLAQINVMGRGTWKSALPVHRNDEIGELTLAFNGLGQALTSRFEHISTSSRLSAFALTGHRLVRGANEAREAILAAIQTLKSADRDDTNAWSAVASLNTAQLKLKQLEGQFQKDFEREVLDAAATKIPST